MAGDLLPDVEDLVVPGEDAVECIVDGLLTAIAAADELAVPQVVQQPGIEDRRARTERTNILIRKQQEIIHICKIHMKWSSPNLLKHDRNVLAVPMIHVKLIVPVMTM